MNQIVEQQDFAREVVRLVELGVNKQINSSITYSPFKLAFNLMKKANPNLMPQIRSIIRDDISKIISDTPEYSQPAFIENDQYTKEGKIVRKSCYNLGIFLMKKKINVMIAFKMLRNHQLRAEIYEFMLDNIADIFKQVGENKNRGQ